LSPWRDWAVNSDVTLCPSQIDSVSDEFARHYDRFTDEG